MKKWIILLVVVALLLAGFIFWPKSSAQNIQNSQSVSTQSATAGKTEVKIGDATIMADISSTPAEREQGLSGRTSLAEGQGMLFVFEQPGSYGFWMKDMNFPIDMVWINAQKVVVGVEKSVSPNSYPQTFMPKEPVLYVLELPAGTSVKNHIDTGTRVYFESKL